MQKFISLLCAVLLVFSASAAPIAPKAELAKKAPVAVEQMQKVQMVAQFKQTPAMNFNQLSATPALKVSNPKATSVRSNQMLKKAQMPARRSAANARKAVNAPQNTAITIGTFAPATLTGEYYVTLTDANSTTQFFYDFDTSVNPFEVGKTYTLDEMIADYVAMGDKDDWYVWDPATAATYTETKDEKGLTHIVASMTTESGETYDLTYDQLPPQDINVTAVDWAYDDYYYDVYLYSETETYLFELQEDLVYGKTYTLADMVPTWVCTLTSGGYPDITATDATLTVTKDEAGLTHIAATMVLNGNKHIIAYDEKPFEPSGVQINVEGTDLNGRYMSGYGFYLYTATWGDYTVQLAFDAAEEKAAYTNDDFIADYGLIYSDSEQIQLLKLASDNITITNTETTKTLAGSIYAKNGDEYILNLVYEKPDAKYIDINVADATLTNKSVAGFWTISGQTADKNNSFNIYFVSKALQGTFTDVEQFDAYSTWVSDKSSGSNVYYENLSEVSLVSVIDGDSLKITGTMNLADANGNPAIVTVYITTPFTQTWGEWADFAPFDLNTGKYTFTAMFNNPVTQRDIPVQVRKDNTGFKQYKFIGWGKQIFTANGIDLIVDMGPDNVCTVAQQDLGFDAGGYGENVQVQDYASRTGQDIPSTYDPETGTFDLALSYFISLGTFGSKYETMVMDKPILERDTVKVNLETIMVEEDVNSTTGAHRGWLYEGQDTDTLYIIQVLGNEQLGTFSYAAGTLGQNYYNIIPSNGQGRQQFTEGEVTIVEDEKGVKLTGLLIGEDEKAYVLNWIQPVGILQYDTDAPFDATFAWGDMNATIEDGVIGIYATNADMQTIGLELYTNPTDTTIPAGTYVISDSYEAGTALKSAGVVGGYLTECWAGNRAATGGISDCWFLVEGTITLSYDEYGKLKVVVDGKNSYGQPVTALVQYEKLEPKSTVEINAEFSVYEGYVEQYGIMNFWGGNEEGYEFDLYAYATTHIGDFVDAVDFGDCEIATPDGTVGVIDAYEFVVATEDGKHITLTAKVLGTDTIQYNITATGFYGALEYDTNDDYEGDFSIVDLAIGQSSKYITIRGINELGDSINLAFVGELVNNAIPAGEYTNVMVSTGINAKGNPTTSFVWNADNLLWFVQSGTLTVNELGAMRFVGLNSYDKNVVINFIAPAPVVTDYYLVGWINGAAYGIEGDIDNFGDYHFVDGKVKATFNELSYVQVKDNNKLIYGPTTYVAPVERGEATLVANGNEKVGINGGVEMEYTLTINDDGTLTLSYAPVATTTFNVTVPEGTDACYLVGTLNAWNINEPIEMTKVDDTHYTYTDEVDLIGHEYKYVHGADWNMVEKDAQGGEISNRVVNASVMNDVVGRWADTPTDLININADVKANKVVRNGRLMIIKNTKVYSVLGQQIQ